MVGTMALLLSSVRGSTDGPRRARRAATQRPAMPSSSRPGGLRPMTGTSVSGAAYDPCTRDTTRSRRLRCTLSYFVYQLSYSVPRPCTATRAATATGDRVTGRPTEQAVRASRVVRTRRRETERAGEHVGSRGERDSLSSGQRACDRASDSHTVLHVARPCLM